MHSPPRLYLGHDGGITYTANGGSTWTDVSTDLPIGQIYKIGQSKHVATTIMGGFQDNGVSATNNGTTFTTIAGGDGMECAIDYSDANFCYRETQGGSLRRSSTGVFGSVSNIITALTDQAAFVAPYMLHRTNPSTMFFGRENMWRSTNVKAFPASSVTWEALSTFTDGATIRVLEQSPANVNIMYMSRGTSPSTLYRSDNVNAAANTVTWNVIAKPGGLTITDIKAHPTNENIVYATAGMKVFKSTNKGVSWADITGNLPALFYNCLVLDYNANEGIYVGNQTGVWYKDATLDKWVLFSTGLPPVDIRELDIYYDANPDNSRITAATYGRGIWQSDLVKINVIDPSDLTATPFSTTQNNLSWTLNPSGNNVLIATSPTTIFGTPVDGTAYTAGNPLPGGGTVLYTGNATGFSHTMLNPNTTYCYKIWSYNGANQYSAGLLPVCANTFSHDWTGNVNTDWFNTGNWGPGTVPTASEGAHIPAGRPNYPLINAAGAKCNQLTIETGASVSMDATIGYTLQVSGDWVNNGTFNRGVGTVEFNGASALQTISGSSTSSFYILNVNKGSQSYTLEAKSLISLHAASNPLVLTSGTFKLSSASTITPFTNSTGASIGTNAGLWNNGGTINSGFFGWTLNSGLLRLSSGTINVGTGTGNSITYLNNGTLIMEGGTLNIAGRFSPNSGASIGTYIQSGGTLTVNTIGSTSATRAPFELNSGVSFTMSGGTIVVQSASSNTSGDVMISSTSHNLTGGTLRIGNASTPASQTIRINCTAPVYNLTVDGNNTTVAQLFTNSLTVKNNVSISTGTLNANSLNLTVGGHWTNNGTFTAGSGLVTFNGAANQDVGGSNATTFNNMTLNNAAGLSLNGSVNATVGGALSLTSGVIATNANKVIIASTGSVARTSGHIFGQLQKNIPVGAGINMTFEIGDASVANYTPATLTFGSVTTAGNLTAQTISGDHPQIGTSNLDAGLSVNRYWLLNNSGTVFTTYDAVFNYLNTDLDMSVNTSNLICGKYNSPNWTYPAMGTKTATSTEITGVSTFSDFQLAEPDNCIEPDIPTLTASASLICAGQSTNLSIASGNLNNATTWQWYQASCGGTPVGTGATITVSPTSTTTFYARGEGGCVLSPGMCGSITITVNALPTPTITGPTAVCSGGSVTLDAGSGYASYTWSDGGGTGQTATYSGITLASTYTVTVTDGNGCQGTDTQTITVNALPTPTITGPSSVCTGGSVTLDAGSGYASYAWSDGGGTGQTATYSGITMASTYTVTVTDNNGCQGTDNQSITVNALPTPMITGPSSVCTGGSVTLDAGSGYAGYAWSDGGGTGQTATYSGITMASTYTVTVTDNNGCQGTDNQSITVNALPTPTITGPGSVCSGGSVTLDAGSGYAAYAWSDGGGAGQTATYSGITTMSTFTVTVTDGNGCQGTDTQTITVNALPTPTITGPTSVCTGGSVTLDAASGYASYAWSDGGGTGQTATYSSLTMTSTYTVTVTGGNGCQGTDTQTITVNALPTPTITGPTSVCTGGSVTLDAGSGYAAYAWSDGGGTGQTATYSGITMASTYTVTVTDNNGCQGTDNQSITVNALPTPTITGPGSVCSGGSVTLDAGSGYAGYAWSDGGGTGQTATYSGITMASTYTVTVTDNNGCQGTDNQTITVNALPTPTITGPGSVCSGGNVTLNAGSGYAAYAWSAGGGTGQSATYSNITTTSTYTVTVTGGNGCQGTDTQTITVNALPTPTITGPGSVCSGGSVTLNAGSGYAAYAWSAGGGTGQTATYSNITTTSTYTVTVTDSNGCQGTDNQTVTVNALPTPTITGPTSVCSGGSVTLNAGSGYAAYVWSAGGGTGQTATYSGITTASTYTVTVTDSNGCQGTDTHGVAVTFCNLEFSGTISWEHDGVSGVNNATVNLTGSGSGSDLTDANGDYMISIPNASGDFTVKPVKNINRLNGVTVADVVAVQNHVNLSSPITNPYKQVAADVNRNNSITTMDATVINQCLLNNPSANNIFNKFWRFVPSTYNLPLPPWGFPEQINLTGVSTNQSGLNFKGIKIGDVVSTWANPANSGSGEPLVWRINDRVLQTGEMVEVEFRVAKMEDVIAFQCAFQFDPTVLQFDSLETLSGAPVSMGDFGLYNVTEGQIRIVWSQTAGIALEDEAPVFRLRFTSRTKGMRLSDVLELNDDELPGKVYNSALAESGVELLFLDASGSSSPDFTGESGVVLNAHPNPFNVNTTISFFLPVATEARLCIFEPGGRELWRMDKSYPAGYHEEIVRLEALRLPGVLYYELTTSQGKQTKKLISLGF